MNVREMSGISRAYLLVTFGSIAIALLTTLGLSLNFKSSSELDGRYIATGQMQLSSGTVINVSHTIVIRSGRFYAMTKQDSTILETSGQVEYGFLGRYRLRVEEGDIRSLKADMDNELVFNLMYGRHKGSIISLVPFRACLYGLETRQVYCATKQPRSL